MPILPKLETSQSVFSNVPLQSQQIAGATPDAFGGITAEAAGKLAQGMQQGGDQVAQAVSRQMDLQRETDANNQYANSFSPALRQIYTNYYALQGKDAVDQLPKFQQQLQDLQQQQRAQLQDPMAQRMFDQVSTRRTQMELDGMSRYADQQNKVYQTQASEGMVKSEQQRASDHWNDPIIFNGALQSVAAERMAHAAAIGQPVEYARAQIQNDTSQMWKDRLSNMALHDPVGAYSMLENGEEWSANGQTQHTDIKSQITPAELPSLENYLMRGAKEVLARNIGRGIIYQGGALDPQTLQGAAQGVPALTGIVKTLEHGTGPNGESLTSPKGAKGEMQVMGPTARDPGFGVTPAKDDSPEELARVGRDYLGAMTARYQDPVLTLAAYNGGPGSVDKWIAKYGDPRTGQISDADWAAKIPFAETRAYVGKGLAILAQQQGQQGARPAALPTSHELQTILPQKVDEARAMADRMFPNDPQFADMVAVRTQGYGNQILEGVRAQQSAATDTITRALVGSKPDGSDRVTSVDQIMSNPTLKTAWSQLTPEGQMAVQNRLSKTNAPLTQDGMNTYYRLRGEAVNNGDAFMNEDLSKLYGQMPDHLVLDLMNRQMSVSKADSARSAKDLNWSRTKSEVEDMLKPLGLGATAKGGTDEAATTATFYGKLEEAIDQYHDQNKKYPDTKTTRQMAAGLISQGSQAGAGWFGMNKDMMAFQSPDLSKFTATVPDDQKLQLAATFKRVMGHDPTDDELNQWYTRYTLSKGRKNGR